MAKYIIKGSNKLEGKVKISGSNIIYSKSVMKGGI